MMERRLARDKTGCRRRAAGPGLVRALGRAVLGFAAAGCAAGPQAEPGAPDGLPAVPIKARLPEGAAVGIDLEVAEAPAARRLALRAYLSEGFGQSRFFDFAWGRRRERTLVVRGRLPDARRAAGTLTTTLVRAGADPVPLRGVRFAGDELVAALDRLILETRLALGEPKDAVAAEKRSVGVLVSPHEQAAVEVGRALELLERRRLAAAAARLDEALRIDASCALALSLAAGIRMDLGLPRKAARLVERMRECEDRASPRALHRAARIWLMAGRNYEGLLRLAREDRKERPHDPSIEFSELLALSMLGRYEEAYPRLAALRARLPDSPGLVFCLAHAALALGHLDEAERLLPDLARRVPPGSVARFELWLRFAQHDDGRLAGLLAKLLHGPLGREPRSALRLHAMQAAHDLLRGRDEDAARILLGMLDELRAAPSLQVEEHRLMLDTVWTLVRLGKAKAAEKMLAASGPPAGAHPRERGPSFVALALCRIALGRAVPARAIDELESMGLSGWRLRLLAARELKRGKPRLALSVLRPAAERSTDPGLVWEMVEAWRALGLPGETKPVLRALAARLMKPRMDRPDLHPLASPALAYMLREARRALARR